MALLARDAQVVHRRSQPLQQDGSASDVRVEQPNAAMTVDEAQYGRFEREFVCVARRCELEHGSDAIRCHGLDHECIHAEPVVRAPDQERPMRSDLAYELGQRVEPRTLTHSGPRFA